MTDGNVTVRHDVADELSRVIDLLSSDAPPAEALVRTYVRLSGIAEGIGSTFSYLPLSQGQILTIAQDENHKVQREAIEKLKAYLKADPSTK